ncbi:MAG: hypothetical protein HXX13_07895 [Bacteroidetes bacterium]|nr:hypothetical protein [Bacteroidota bacterium]
MRIRTFLQILLFLCLSLAGYSETLSLEDALKKGIVSAEISGRPYDSSRIFLSSYYGPCLNLHLKSKSHSTLSIILENGRFLETADTSEQRMIVTQQELISLLPDKEKKIAIYAMCTQMHDHSPGSKSRLSMGPMASGNLLKLTRFIGHNKFQDQAAQETIWVITDDNSPDNIYSENENELKTLQSFITELTGKKLAPLPQRIEYAEGIASGEIIFENKEKEAYTMKILNEEGETIVTYFEDQPIEKPTRTTLTWRFRYKGFPKGVYYVKLMNSSRQLIANRPIIIK